MSSSLVRVAHRSKTTLRGMQTAWPERAPGAWRTRTAHQREQAARELAKPRQSDRPHRILTSRVLSYCGNQMISDRLSCKLSHADVAIDIVGARARLGGKLIRTMKIQLLSGTFKCSRHGTRVYWHVPHCSISVLCTGCGRPCLSAPAGRPARIREVP